MQSLEKLMGEIEELKFTDNQKCIELLDNRLQDVLLALDEMGHKASGELIDLKRCSWVLHERYHMDTEEELKWTFHHTRHRMLRDLKCIKGSMSMKPMPAESALTF
jgi:hypothetical protein